MPSPPLQNTFEGGTDTVVITTANSGGASGDPFDFVQGPTPEPTYSATQARDTLSCVIAQPGSFSSASVRWEDLGSLTTSVYFRAYLWIPSTPGSAMEILRARTSAAAGCASVAIAPAGGLRSRNAANTNIGTLGSVTVPSSQWVRIEWRVLASTTAGESEWRLYTDPDSTTIADTDTATSAVLGANLDQIMYGSTSGPASYTWYFDDIAVSSTDWLGPAVTPAPPTTEADNPPMGIGGRGAGW
jgi:hypothetical protein